MMDEQIKEELIERFRAYLDTDFGQEPAEANPVDMMTLFSELAGLKNEVRIESRQLKGALDDFRQAFSSLDHANQDVAKMLHHIQRQEKESARATLKPVVLGLIDLHDRIGAGLEQQPPALSFIERVLARGQGIRKWQYGHLEAQKMILGRVLDLLNQCGVSAVETKDQKFDPNCMKAVGFKTNPLQENGMVLHENRKGFRFDGKNIRTAEVIVNKREE
jgi:molecular chaperone GrpE